MKFFTTYNTSTGIIEDVTGSDCELSDLPTREGFTIVEGSYEPGSYKFVDGEPVEIIIDFWEIIRSQRDGLLKDCDWTQMPDSPLTSSKKTEWATYRQSLRDLPSTYSSAESASEVIFPTTPS
jgi:hypothetical protein